MQGTCCGVSFRPHAFILTSEDDAEFDVYADLDDAVKENSADQDDKFSPIDSISELHDPPDKVFFPVALEQFASPSLPPLSPTSQKSLHRFFLA
jgi:hypothetical protein